RTDRAIADEPLLGWSLAALVRALSRSALRVLPHCHPMDAEALCDRQDALTARPGGSDSVHFPLGQRCSRPSRWVRHHPRLGLGRRWLLARAAPSRLLPRRTQPFEPTLGVRFGSSRVHPETNAPPRAGRSSSPCPFPRRAALTLRASPDRKHAVHRPSGPVGADGSTRCTSTPELRADVTPGARRRRAGLRRAAPSAPARPPRRRGRRTGTTPRRPRAAVPHRRRAWRGRTAGSGRRPAP